MPMMMMMNDNDHTERCNSTFFDNLLTVPPTVSNTCAWVAVKNFGFTEKQKNIEQGSRGYSGPGGV